MTTGFLQGKVGHKITLTIATTNVANDTEIVRYFDVVDAVDVLLNEITVVYTDGTRAQLLSAERTA
jgi:hypothetical protein